MRHVPTALHPPARRHRQTLPHGRLEATVRRLRQYGRNQALLVHGGATLRIDLPFRQRDRNNICRQGHYSAASLRRLVAEDQQPSSTPARPLLNGLVPPPRTRTLCGAQLRPACTCSRRPPDTDIILMLGGQYRPNRTRKLLAADPRRQPDQLRGFVRVRRGRRPVHGVCARRGGDIWRSVHLYRLAVTNARETVLLSISTVRVAPPSPDCSSGTRLRSTIVT